MVKAGDDEARLDIWNSIQVEKEKMKIDPPLFWPPLRVMNLELCTESLGSETGSDGFSSDEELYSYFSPFSDKRDSFVEKAGEMKQRTRKELTKMNHHCSICRDSQPPRSFPPPLSSTFIQMRPLRCDGRLILEAISVPSLNYLHAERHSSRLVLSFISQLVEEDEEDEEEKSEGEEEDTQAVDGGTEPEVKVSTKLAQANGVAAVKVLWSSLAINKFAVRAALDDGDESTVAAGEEIYLTTAAAAAMLAGTVGMFMFDGFHYHYIQPKYLWSCVPRTPAAAESKMLFRSKRRSREELLRDIRRCIFEPPLAFVTLS
ncbi:protein FAF-like, chloroplastic [Dendrobium catenatum]|uniref:Protein FAF-like, chloroplastic n=1 Tax=Dendrobium catenatum TaxID=906689 RepID=A0A2I0XHW6_9ASPA|nr:protein FAF-like, chloroplastic [Dendrobium catenatum]PKU87474.1 Protein FAF-like, chloroplastic [Dendrobium catenatum]